MEIKPSFVGVDQKKIKVSGKTEGHSNKPFLNQ